MKVFGLNIKIEREEKAVTKASPLTSLMWKDSAEGLSGLLANAYEQSVWVYRAVNVLAEQVANIPFRFSRSVGDGEEVIKTGPLVDFYNRPHPRLNAFQYWELRVIWLMLRGECFRVPIFDESAMTSASAPDTHGGRRLRAVLLLDPASFEEVVQDSQLVGWRYRDYRRDAPLSSQVLLPEEVWHDRLPNPFNFWRGLSPLALANVAAATDYAASQHMKGVMENNGDAGLVMKTSQPLDPEQREQLIAACLDRKRRAGRADRPLLLWGGTEIVTPKLSSADAQFLANRRYSCSEICAAFGVPEEIVTSTDNAKYDVMAGSRLNFIENRVVPLCRRLAAEEAVTVRTMDPTASCWFDVEDHPVLAEARRSRLATAKIGFDMGIPFNDLNRTLDLGFEPLPWGDDGYLATAVQKIGEERRKDDL